MHIRSGGQTGVDRAALDVAIEYDIPHGGWCPRGRLAEDGTIDEKYQLTETDSEDVSERTKLNIRDSDGTLILVESLPLEVTDGTVLTMQEAEETGRPFLLTTPSEENLDDILAWISENNIRDLNIAGPRESSAPEIYETCVEFLRCLYPRVLAQPNATYSPLMQP